MKKIRDDSRLCHSTKLAQQAMVRTASTDAGGSPTASSNLKAPAIPAIRPGSRTPPVGNLQTGGLASIRSRFETEDFSSTVVDILFSSWSESIKERYSGPWRAWADWCTAREWCPLSEPIKAVLEFLSDLLNNLEYRTIAVYK